MRASNSSASIPFGQKVSELASFFSVRLREAYNRDAREQNISNVFSNFVEYEQLLAQYSNVSLQNANVFEVGFGARPLRLMTLLSLGINARGVDLDRPVLRGTPYEFLQIYRRNGLERLLKSLIRFTLFDIREKRTLAKVLKQRGCRLTIVEDRFLVNDAAEVDIPEQSLDLIFSEGVYEHISLSSLETLIPKTARWLKPNGLALIRPGIFTGIIGGHLAEWFPHTIRDKPLMRKSEPWEHLRKKRYRANTYLNELSRTEYRRLFTPYFYILEEKVADPDLGREFLTVEVRRELKDYPEEELFSNLVLFVLRPKR